VSATRGRHASADGSFGRSAGAAAGRGALLLAIAVVLGIVLLQAADDAPPGQEVTSGGNGGGAPATTSTSEAAATTTLPLRPPAQVKVLVANGSGVPKAAARTSALLQPHGYNLLAPIDGTKAEASAVFFTAGFEREAAEVAKRLELPDGAAKAMSDPPPVSNLREANVVVHVGPELAERVSAT
jgi:hypothetical protein